MCKGRMRQTLIRWKTPFDRRIVYIFFCLHGSFKRQLCLLHAVYTVHVVFIVRIHVFIDKCLQVHHGLVAWIQHKSFTIQLVQDGHVCLAVFTQKLKLTFFGPLDGHQARRNFDRNAIDLTHCVQ